MIIYKCTYAYRIPEYTVKFSTHEMIILIFVSQPLECIESELKHILSAQFTESNKEQRYGFHPPYSLTSHLQVSDKDRPSHIYLIFRTSYASCSLALPKLKARLNYIQGSSGISFQGKHREKGIREGRSCCDPDKQYQRAKVGDSWRGSMFRCILLSTTKA